MKEYAGLVTYTHNGLKWYVRNFTNNQVYGSNLKEKAMRFYERDLELFCQTHPDYDYEFELLFV